jgi:hypothetical protein
MIDRRNDEGVEEHVGTEGVTNCTHVSQGVEGSMGVREGELLKEGRSRMMEGDWSESGIANQGPVVRTFLIPVVIFS